MDLDPVVLRRWRLGTLAVYIGCVMLWFYFTWPTLQQAVAAFGEGQAQLHLIDPGTTAYADGLTQLYVNFLTALLEPALLLLTLTVGTLLLYRFVLAERAAEDGRLHERINPALERIHRYSVDPGEADDPLPEVPDRFLAPVLEILDQIAAGELTIEEAHAQWEDGDELTARLWEFVQGWELFATTSPSMADIHLQSLGRLTLTDRGHRQHRILRRRYHAMTRNPVKVPRDRLQRRSRLHLEDCDVWLVRSDDTWHAFWDADPIRGRPLTWRNGALHARATGSVYAPNGNLRQGPGSHGLTRFPVTADDDALYVNLTELISGAEAEHADWVREHLWDGYT